MTVLLKYYMVCVASLYQFHPARVDTTLPCLSDASSTPSVSLHNTHTSDVKVELGTLGTLGLAFGSAAPG